MAEKMVGIPDFDQATPEGYRTKSLVDAREATHSLIDQVNSRAEWLMARINMYRSGDQIVKFTPASMHYRLHPMEPFPDEWREEQRLSWQTFGSTPMARCMRCMRSLRVPRSPMPSTS